MTKPTQDLEAKLEMLVPCISCGVNASREDGFGTCTCGNETLRGELLALIADRERLARLGEQKMFQVWLYDPKVGIGGVDDWSQKRIQELQATKPEKEEDNARP